MRNKFTLYIDERLDDVWRLFGEYVDETTICDAARIQLALGYNIYIERIHA